MSYKMHLATVLTAAVGLAAVGTGLRGDLPADSVVNHDADQIKAAPDTTVDAVTAGALRQRLANLVNSACTTNGFDGLVGDLSRADREKIGDGRYKNYSSLNAQIDRFRHDFHDKYNQDFSFDAAQLNDAKITRGPDNDHAVLLLTDLGAPRTDVVPPPSGPMPSRDLSTPPSDVTPVAPSRIDIQPQSASGAWWPSADVSVPQGNLRSLPPLSQATRISNIRGVDKYFDLRTVTASYSDGTVAQDKVIRAEDLPPSLASGTGTFVYDRTVVPPTAVGSGASLTPAPAPMDLDTLRPAVSGLLPLRPLTLPLVNEGGLGNGWRIDVPSNITGQQLADALEGRLKTLCDNRASWPDDINRTYRIVCLHIGDAISTAGGSNVSSER